jgi:uncharacterized protein YidB (DUF937 family)
MLEQIMGLIKDHSQEAIVNNPAIPNEHNESAMSEILSSVVGGLANQGAQGNMAGLWSLLSGKNASSSSNPIMSAISQQAVGALMGKFGLDKGAAGGIIAAVLPKVMESVISKTNDPNDSSMDLDGLMGAITKGQGAQQGQGGGLMDLLGGFLGNK